VGIISCYLVADFRIIFERDPAARNWLEVYFATLVCKRSYCTGWLTSFIALHTFIPRLISFFARFFD